MKSSSLRLSAYALLDLFLSILPDYLAMHITTASGWRVKFGVMDKTQVWTVNPNGTMRLDHVRVVI